MTKPGSRMRIFKLVSLVVLGAAAISGIVLIVMRYMDILAKPYYSLKRGRELSADACAFTEEDDSL
ncbi:hypothetical protein LJC34_01570 [Oscillospiraceae bacterium OttesenSCG-928-G22]|nr:hypothetical protein [Oscillospiraceae bacterium OttesenSCG-928-G22]